MKLRNILCCILFVAATGSASAQNMGAEHIISFCPIVVNESGFGSGLSWERFLLKDRWLSFIIPVSAVIRQQDNNHTDNMFYCAPGVKFYTNLHSYRHIKFSVGPSLVLGAGKGIQSNYISPVYLGEQSRFLYGFMVTGGLNLFPLPHIYLGADLGFGITSLNMYDGVNRDISSLAHLSFRIGYRFNSPAPIRQSSANDY